MKPPTPTKLLKPHAIRPIRQPGRSGAATAGQAGKACTAGPNGCANRQCHCTRKGRAVRGGQGKSNGNVGAQ